LAAVLTLDREEKRNGRASGRTCADDGQGVKKKNGSKFQNI